MHDTNDHHDGGLAVDLPALLGRRRMLGLLGSAGLVALVGCSGDDGGAASTTAGDGTTTSAATGGTATGPIPEETAGPFPGDGTNGPNVLTESGVVRSDITSSFGELSGTAEGLPLALALTVVDATTGDPLPGAALYAWHCDRDGGYSLYSDGLTEQNYLRGVQEAGADGALGFTTVFPGCYPGRWPHVHFEVYADLAAATSGAGPLATSQLAFPEDVCTEVYGSAEGYGQSVGHLGQLSLGSDMVFADGAEQQLATMSGSPDAGLTATLLVPI